jgi:hypothetical protein
LNEQAGIVAQTSVSVNVAGIFVAGIDMLQKRMHVPVIGVLEFSRDGLPGANTPDLFDRQL